MRRVWPAANGILKPSGAVFSRPWTEYVQKLSYLRCSPSVITGDPVASKRSMVSLTAASYWGSSFGSAISPAATAEINSGGRGILPIGSVGIIIAAVQVGVARPFSIHVAHQYKGRRDRCFIAPEGGPRMRALLRLQRGIRRRPCARTSPPE